LSFLFWKIWVRVNIFVDLCRDPIENPDRNNTEDQIDYVLECWELKESSESLCNNTGYNVLKQEWNVQEAENLYNIEGTVKNCGSVTKVVINFITFSQLDFDISVIIRSD